MYHFLSILGTKGPSWMAVIAWIINMGSCQSCFHIQKCGHIITFEGHGGAVPIRRIRIVVDSGG